MTKLRYLLYETTGKDAAKTVASKLVNLEALFQKVHKRKLPVELYVSSFRDGCGLTAYYETHQRADLEFLIKNIA